MRLTVSTAERSSDYNVTLLSEDITLGDLLDELGIGRTSNRVVIDGRVARINENVRHSGLVDGSVIEPEGRPVDDDVDMNAPPAARLSRVAGVGAGEALDLSPGLYDLGNRDDVNAGLRFGSVRSPSVRIRVDQFGHATVTSMSDRPVFVAGIPITGEQPLDGHVVSVTDAQGQRSMFVVGPVGTRGSRRLVSTRPGRVMFLRPPRRIYGAPDDPVAIPAPPEGVPSLQPLSLIALLAPIPMAVVMAFIFSPRMLLMAFFSPMLMVGRWLDGKRRVRLAKARIERELVDKADEFATTIAAACRLATRHRLVSQPHLGELIERVDDGDPRLWERRLGHDDFLDVTVGYGSMRHHVEIADKLYSPLHDVHAGARLHEAPLTVSLTQHGALGVAGDARAARALVRAVVAEMVTLQGPADVHGAIVSSDATAWSWAKWLPHMVDDHGNLQIATDDASIRRILDTAAASSRSGASLRAIDESPQTHTVVVLDGDDMIDAHTIRAAEALFANPDLRVIAIASDPDQLPSFCAAVAVVDERGGLSLRDPLAGHGETRGLAVLASVETSESIARALSRLDDPERSSATGGIPAYAALEELLSTEDLTPRDVVTRWAHHRSTPKLAGGLDAIVGVTQDGPFSIDIVRDGPHAVIAGTTGSGKSEMLRSWVASLASRIGPDRVNFVLVDFKGGGAFDACEDFPHTVGVVTDLDEHLSARALRCLQAELKFREAAFRRVGASNLDDYWAAAPDEPLPRLMLIVDEFATLAQELPEFLASLVDIAQRGRSLGIHMVLATQRPSGVLDAKIKANTNLRVALRVQDPGDSVDVIGVKAAAEIDRRFPGRAMARLGASEIIGFQSAIVSVHTDRTLRHSVEVVPFGLGVTPTMATTMMDDVDGPNDLEQLVDAVGRAAELAALPAPRVPWPAPLPTAIEISDLTPVEGASWSATIGLADVPDEQCQKSYTFDATRGHLAIYGADASNNTLTAASIALGLAAQTSPSDLHVYALDYGSGGLAPLSELTHVGAYVAGTDEERVIRVIDRVERELDHRRTQLAEQGLTRIGPDSGEPLLVLIIDNYAAFVSAAEESGRLELPGRVGSIVRDGASLGVVVVATSIGERGLPMKVGGQIEQKLVFRLADPSGYSSFGLRARDVPQLGPGRAIDIASSLEIQVAHPAAAGIAGDVRRINTVYARSEPNEWPEPIVVLPDAVDRSDVIGHSASLADRWCLAVGLGFKDLGPAGFTLRNGQHIVVCGPPGSGRTTTLLTLADAALLTDGRVVTIGMDPEAVRARTGIEAIDEPAQLDALDHDGRLLVLVDDADRVHTDLTDAIARLVEARNPNVHFAVAAPPEEWGSFHSWTKPLRNARIGLLLQPHRDDGDILKSRLPIRGASTFGPGRGFLVNSGVHQLVQVSADIAALERDLRRRTPTPLRDFATRRASA